MPSPSLAAPGIHRLNRTEYQNVIRDLIGLKIDAAKFLPSDNSTHGFDNIAGALTMSPALMEAYLSAAGKISRLAMASNTAPTFVEFNVPDDATQNYHVEGLPFGTRGGTLIEHEFPADGEYVFRIVPIFEGNMGQANDPFGQIQGERLAVTIDGQQVKLFDWDKEMQGAPRSGVPTPAIPVKAGLHRVGVTFLATNYAPDNNINDVFLRATIETGGIPGYLFFPHVGKGADRRTVQRQPRLRHAEPPQDFRSCRPDASPGCESRSSSEEACARTILSTLARRAFRRPATPADVDTLMEFYASGRRAGTFDDGIEKALRRLLADPEFVYRREIAPATVPAGGHLSHQRPGTGVPAVVLPLEQHAGRRAADAGGAGTAARAGDAREAGAADGGRSEVGGADREFRRSVAEPARAGHRRAQSQRLSGFRRQPAAGVSPRGRAPVRQHRPRGPQRPGSADRGLHVRRRAARPALRDSERLRQPVPARDVSAPTSTCGAGCSARAP